MSFKNQESFISSFVFCVLFIFFSCLNMLDRTSSTMSNKSNTVDILVFFSISRGNIQYFTINYVDSCRFLWVLFIKFRKFSSIPVFWSVFNYLWVFEIFQMCFLLQSIWSCDFSSRPVNMVFYTGCFMCIEQVLE